MGVRQMMTFVKSTIQSERRLQAPLNPDGSPSSVIVFDALGGMRRYFNEGSYLWDFQWTRDQVRSDVNAFRKAGFRLVVVLDGGVDTEKFRTWFGRRREELKHLRRLNTHLTSYRLHEAPDKELWHPPQGCSHYLAQAFRDAGCEVHISLEDADHEIAWLVAHHGAFGVLTCDTDFIVFPGVDRYMDVNTLEIGKKKGIRVGMVCKEEICSELGLSEEELPGIAAVMGNDVIKGALGDLQALQLKWGVQYGVQAAACEVKSCPDAWSSKIEQAKEYYVPVEPTPNNQCNTKGFILMQTQTFMRGIAIEALNKERSIHETLAPLSKAVYARSGLKSVKEHLCIPSMRVEQWKDGWTIEITEDDVKAPMPPSSPGEVAILICQYLRAQNAISDFHFCALIGHVVDRNLLRREMKAATKKPVGVPRLEDLHASALYLHAIEILWMGIEGVKEPRCWEMYDGVLFHFLCQKRQLLDPKFWPKNRRMLEWDTPMFDWKSA
ncbi:hypothetical protein BSKO_03997 [Bryopsis sp. KO-2023]|nr:hypothetical protein BSKO_03997 [Bryopsis sp. KO-2023]